METASVSISAEIGKPWDLWRRTGLHLTDIARQTGIRYPRLWWTASKGGRGLTDAEALEVREVIARAERDREPAA